ncbi:MAG: hypothetical protein ABJH72_00655 [Reichenbachiella sp.]|uniref:hypothetical protein n=1 Tax=Reichenbachiella sp. TaxID=2184521 RepID=UPI0032677ABF
MKYIGIILITIATASIGCSQSQQRQRPHKFPDAAQIEKMVEELSLQLELTDEQKKNVSSLFSTHFEEAKATKQKTRETMEGLRKEFIEQVTAEIGEDKEDEFKTFMKSKRPKGKGGERPPNKDK